MNRGARAQVRNGVLMPKNGCTYEALAQEAYLTDPKRETVEHERLRRLPRRLSQAPAGIMRMRGKR